MIITARPGAREFTAGVRLPGNRYTAAMRIIAGTWRGRRIAAPPGDDRTRPILDRAKTVLFDTLGHLLARPGVMPPVVVADLFAGSGALGLEALSRGAAYCLFVEQHRAVARLLRENLDTLGVIREARVLEADAAAWIPVIPGDAAGPQGQAAYGLVFVDPPYRLLAGPQPDAGVAGLLRRLAASPAVAPDAVIVVRHAAGPADVDLGPLVQFDRRVVGTMTLRFLRPPPRGGEPGDPTGACR